ncbi:MAG: acyl carrier protein [Ruminococcus flavefaciens]|nr:acyl carrier protein [Ruminococcus flavefaciens]
MSDQEKVEAIADILELEVEELSTDTVLEEIEAWDSVAVLSVISVMDEKFGKLPHASEILKCKTVFDLMRIMQ